MTEDTVLTANFLQASPFTLRWERGAGDGWVNDPHDPGAETFCGISRRAWPNWEGWAKLDSMKTAGSKWRLLLTPQNSVYDMVDDFFFNTFWEKYDFDALTAPMAAVCFDTVVQHGKGVRLIQNACHALGYDVGDADNTWSPRTAEGVVSLGKSMPDDFVDDLIDIRHKYYAAQNNPAEFNGWMNRLRGLHEFIATLQP